MAEQRAQRRLAAILAADIVGYSRLMELDEAGTLARVKALRAELLHPKVAAYGGRIVKTTGDGTLIEFPSAVDAVQHAVEVQLEMARRSATEPDGRRIELRMGINLGDIIIDGDDIYGDGVNVAARLEGLAEPGSICISGTVHEHVRGKLDASFDDLGPQMLKNIAKPVQTYRVLLQPSEAKGMTGLTLPDKPSIAVLPFQNMSGDPEQDYFADGMVEDIITGLSRIKWLFVIARNSTFVYKGRSVDMKQVGRELGVRYVLEGSVRKAGHRVRLTGQLIDAATGTHVWANRYDGALDDIFELQDQITASVIGAVEPNLQQAEFERSKRKRPDSLDAYDLYLRAFAHAYANTPQDGREAIRLLEHALQLEPTYAAAHGIAAWCHQQLYYRAGFLEENKTALVRHAAAAIAYGADDSTALCLAGFSMAMTSGDQEVAFNAVDRGLALNPSYAAGYAYSAVARAFAGQYEMAIEHAQRALRLNPLGTMGYHPYLALALAYLALGRFEESASAVANAIQLNPKFSFSHALHAVTLVKLERTEAARAAAARLMELMPNFNTRMLSRYPYAHRKFASDVVEAARIAGIPQ